VLAPSELLADAARVGVEMESEIERRRDARAALDAAVPVVDAAEETQPLLVGRRVGLADVVRAAGGALVERRVDDGVGAVRDVAARPAPRGPRLVDEAIVRLGRAVATFRT
jgi:glutathione S-transferase